MAIVFCVLAAFVLGVCAGRNLFRPDTLGTIRVARSEEDNETYLFLELEAGVEEVMSRKLVMFNVSQK